MSQTKFVQKIFDKKADSYDQWVKKFGIDYRKKIDEKLEEVILGMGKPVSILDMGCGTATRLKKIIETFPDHSLDTIVAGDLSWKMLKQAKLNLSGFPVYCFQGKVEALPFASSQFDVVLLLYAVLGCIFPSRARIQALKECLRVLKPKGVLILDVLSRDHPMYRDNTAIFEEAKIYQESQGWEWGEGDFLVEKEKGMVVMNHVFHRVELEKLTSSLFSKFDWCCFNTETGELSDEREGHFFGILQK